MEKIKKYLEKNPSDDLARKLLGLENHFQKIYEATGQKFRKLHGSFLFDGINYEYKISELERQKLLLKIAQNNSSCLEIGTNMGHSSLIMLVANPKMQITTIDIESLLAKPATDYLRNAFPDCKVNFLNHSSPEILDKITSKFDFFLIDGDHSYFPVFREFMKVLKLSNDKKNIKILFDDLDMAPLLQKSINLLKIINFMEAKCEGGYSSYYEINIEKNLGNFLRFSIFFFINYFFNIFGYLKYYFIKLIGEKNKNLLKKILKFN